MLSNHFDGQRFFNPSGPPLQPFSAVPRLLLERRTRWPSRLELLQRRPVERGDASGVVTFIGHSTFLIQTAAGNLLTDPIYSLRAGPFNIFGPRRVRPPAVAFDDLPPISVVLLSHNHYDHCDVPTLRRLAKRFDPMVVTPLGNRTLVKSAGIRRIEEIDWWQQAGTAPMPITATPAHHFSARTPFDRNRALWSGFVFEAGARRLYFAGDTAFVPFFSEIKTRLGPIDLALLPIGAYEPRWFMRAAHMNPQEAVQAHVALGSTQSIAMHYGTFQLTTEGIDEPAQALSRALVESGIDSSRFRALDFGASFTVR